MTSGASSSGDDDPWGARAPWGAGVSTRERTTTSSGAPLRPPPVDRTVQRAPRALRLLRRHRRTLAFVLGLLGVLMGLGALKQEPPSWAGLVFNRDLPAGHTVSGADVRNVELPLTARPAGAVSDIADLGTDNVLASPVQSGEVVAAARFVGSGLLGGAPAGYVAVPIPLPDQTALQFVKVGQRVDVLASARSPTEVGQSAGPAQTVARDALVVALPSSGAAADTSPGLGSALQPGSLAAEPSGALVLAVPPDVARELAGAAVTSELSLVLRSA